MGIYDRDYYRQGGSSYLDRGQVTLWLVLINAGIFVLQLATKPGQGLANTVGPFTENFRLDTVAVEHFEVWRLLTYAFLHSTGGFFHIFFNMLFLWMVGRDVEDIYGSREFLAFYLMAALLGGLTFQAVWMLGIGNSRLCLGASGAVSAVAMLCALHYPTKVFLIWGILPVPIWLIVLFQVAQDTLTFLGGVNTGTAVTVHIAGWAFGFFYYKTNWRVLGMFPDWAAWRREAQRPRLRVYREEEEAVPVAAAPPRHEVDEHLEAKLDAILEKVGKKENLTDQERAILMKASEIFRKKRK